MAKAIDMHVHLPTASFMQNSLGPFAEAAESFFRNKVPIREMDEVARYYEGMDIVGVLLAWDAETATGLPALTNDEVADVVKKYPRQFIGFASVDPWKGERAVEEMERAITELGLSGAKFHPGLQAFYPNDTRFYPLYEKITELKVPALFHTGTNGLGAGTPGGMGVKLDYSRPIYLDHVAADFPKLTIIGAHPAWPWHEEIFGSDYPFITPERWLADFDALEGFKPEVRQKILHDNAAKILKLRETDN
jgi:predicted TIM-barrel fold metal-dependent hydrolase